MEKSSGPIHYSEYLQLDKILSAQDPQSAKAGNPCHDETLFIITHQTYELWFKQIHHELDYLLQVFNQDYVLERDLGTVVARLGRIIEIQKLLLDQFTILETMTPLDFLDFRNHLIPASGFQSVQFRAFELKLGLTWDQRPISKKFVFERLSLKEREYLEQVGQQRGLLPLLNDWLERIPFLVFKDYDFWKIYGETVDIMLKKDLKIIEENVPTGTPERRQQIEELQKTRENFQSLLDPHVHNKLVGQGQRKLSHMATLSALFILLYRDEPLLHLPFRIIHSLMDVDELLTSWRYRHALLAHRMLGTKIGTGGSSGHHYLKTAADQGRIFTDIYNLSTFLIPRSILPSLPPELQDQTGFSFKRS